jgi:hypothetical protein
MTFAAALLSLFLAALPGNLVDMYRAAVLSANSRKSALRIAALISFLACPALIVVIMIESWGRMYLALEIEWSIFVISLWSTICVLLLYGAFRDYMLFREK